MLLQPARAQTALMISIMTAMTDIQHRATESRKRSNIVVIILAGLVQHPRLTLSGDKINRGDPMVVERHLSAARIFFGCKKKKEIALFVSPLQQ